MNREVQRSDEEWVQLLLRGDQDAFTAIYRKCSGAVYRFALYMTGDAQLAEEITQDTFLFFLGNASSYTARRGSLQSWLLGVARNTSRRAVAAESEVDSLADWPEFEIADGVDVFEDYAHRELVAAVRQVVGTLPATMREVVILCELQELDYKEAGSVLGCPIGTVKSRLNRARALLISKLRTRCSA